MKKYRSLKSFHYEYANKPDEYDKIVNFRITNGLSIHTNLLMSPFENEFRLNKTFEIFYLPIPQISLLEEEIYKLSSEIKYKMANLPRIASDQIFYSNLIDELQSTNDIEGVTSSKAEIRTAIDTELGINSSKNPRFYGLVELYMNFQKDKYHSIKEIEDFRKIWDKLVSKEVDDNDQLKDNEMFRSEGENILSGTGEIIHRGDYTQEQIKEDLFTLVREMNNEDIPSLPKCFIAHYYYEYIHPFYDGNGRTGRFIACSYLSKKLDYMSAITFSYLVSQNKNLYYKSFVEMANKYNYGEATCFIINMMNILIKGQEYIIGRLDKGKRLLNKADDLIKDALGGNNESDEAKILFILCQKSIFGKYLHPITDQYIRRLLGTSNYMFKKNMDNLEIHGLVKVIRKRPKIHNLSTLFKEKLFFE